MALPTGVIVRNTFIEVVASDTSTSSMRREASEPASPSRGAALAESWAEELDVVTSQVCRLDTIWLGSERGVAQAGLAEVASSTASEAISAAWSTYAPAETSSGGQRRGRRAGSATGSSAAGSAEAETLSPMSALASLWEPGSPSFAIGDVVGRPPASERRFAHHAAAKRDQAEGDQEEVRRDDVPVDGDGELLTSVGSSGHGQRACAPCVFVRSEVGCKFGVDCQFCHLRHDKVARVRPCKGKRTRVKKVLSLIEARVALNPDALHTEVFFPPIVNQNPRLKAQVLAHLERVAEAARGEGR